ncbi:uncharacterized protein LOC141605442 [Silene latifolia]|uniref:uncharacterized protein LOC141605442 n=1 Tax=Silene latifolia TaxID=37657 RepID=UPI003D785CA7
MFFAVEGGGFFSSSASGYSKGLSLLLLGHKSDEKHMRVAPWNQYRLVDQETNSDLQLASGKHRLSRGCASFVCFSRTSAGLDGQSPLKVGPTEPQDSLPSDLGIERDKELRSTVHNEIIARRISLKSSMKKASHNIPQSNLNNGEQEPLTEEGSNPEGLKEKRKVQWTDTCGKELTEIREFELSERGESDDEFANGNGKTCSCRIM